MIIVLLIISVIKKRQLAFINKKYKCSCCMCNMHNRVKNGWCTTKKHHTRVLTFGAKVPVSKIRNAMGFKCQTSRILLFRIILFYFSLVTLTTIERSYNSIRDYDWTYHIFTCEVYTLTTMQSLSNKIIVFHLFTANLSSKNYDPKRDIMFMNVLSQ